MKNIKLILVIIITIVVSVILTLFLRNMISKPILSSEWHYSNNNKFELFFSTEAIFGENSLPSPDISTQNFRWKIIHPTKDAISVGWQVEISIATISKAIIDKYYKKRKERDPTFQALNFPYNLEIRVHFFDEDDFKIIKHKKTTTILSGRSEFVQGELDISLEKALRLHHSSMEILVFK